MSGSYVNITGTSEVISGLNREVAAIKGRTRGGMSACLALVRRTVTPLTPIKTGNLRRSFRSRVFGTGMPGNPIYGAIWYECSYALFVHERKVRPWKMVANLSGRMGKRWGTGGAHRTGEQGHRPPTQWKFLETAMSRCRGQILAILRESARIR
jgi:hypothetical protein